jgi:hypothetical protein
VRLIEKSILTLPNLPWLNSTTSQPVLTSPYNSRISLDFWPLDQYYFVVTWSNSFDPVSKSYWPTFWSSGFPSVPLFRYIIGFAIFDFRFQSFAVLHKYSSRIRDFLQIIFTILFFKNEALDYLFFAKYAKNQWLGETS